MKVHRGLRVAMLLMALLTVIALVLPALKPPPLQATYSIPKLHSIYTDAVTSTNPDITVVPASFESAMRDFEDGENIAVYDVTALPLTAANRNYTFTPHITQTVVIAVDRAQTDEQIQTFSDLLTTDLPISFDFGNTIAQNAWEYTRTHSIVMAMAQAMYGEFDIDRVAQDFAELDSEDRFFTDDMTKPVIVTMDSTAVALIKDGRELDIIIPSDGTLSFDFGAMVYSNSIALFDTLPETLLESGYRLPSGEADRRYYPSPSEYERAVYIEDYDEYNAAVAVLSKTMRRDAFDTRRFGFANQIETTSFFLPLLLFIICYLIGIRRRITHANIRKNIVSCLILLIFFILTGLLKLLNSTSPVLETALWYIYYLPLLLMPALFVKVAISVGTGTLSKKVADAYNLYFALTFIPLLLVFTNSFHNAVFIVHDYMHSYFTHNYGYFFVMAWVAVSVAFAYSMLVYKNIASPRKGAFVYPAIVSITLLVYTVARSAGFTPFMEFDFTFAVTIMVVLYIEACMQSRLFPTNKGYSIFFAHSNLAMEITDNKGNAVYKSLVAQNIDENFVRRSSTIVGGKFYYFEDYTAINTAELKLSAINETVKKNNEFLLQKQEVKANLAALSAEKSAYESIDHILLTGTEKIRNYIQQIAKGADKKKLMTAINVCATIMKRDSMYRINALFRHSQPMSILVNSFSEIKELMDDTDLAITIRCAVYGNLSTENMAVIYSFFTFAVEKAVGEECGQLLLQIYEVEGETVFSVVADKPLFHDGDMPILPVYNNAYKMSAKEWEEGEMYLLTFDGDTEGQYD